jgi:hypothetical protein
MITYKYLNPGGHIVTETYNSINDFNLQHIIYATAVRILLGNNTGNIIITDIDNNTTIEIHSDRK